VSKTENKELHSIFSKYIPLLANIRQFLTAIKVSQEVIPDLNLKINLKNLTDIKNILKISNILKVKKDKLTLDEFLIILKNLRNQIDSAYLNENQTLKVYSQKGYPNNNIIYTQRNNPEPVVREYVEDRPM